MWLLNYSKLLKLQLINDSLNRLKFVLKINRSMNYSKLKDIFLNYKCLRLIKKSLFSYL